MIWSTIYLISFSLVFITNTKLYAQKNASNPYSFIVAGHTYGSPQHKKPGLHPPFVTDFNYIRNLRNMSFGVFTGDIVYRSHDDYWNQVDDELCQLSMPVYFTACNHEVGHKDPYKKRYGRTYYSFTQEQDLIIVLNPGLGGWNI